MYQLDLEKAEEAEIKLLTFVLSLIREFQENIYLCFTDYAEVFDCGSQQLRKILKNTGIQTTLLVSWETCMQAGKQQLEPDMEQWTGSKLGKEYVKAVYCHPTYLTSRQSTSWKMPQSQDCWEKYQVPDMQVKPF